jgi:hypothetical protein
MRKARKIDEEYILLKWGGRQSLPPQNRAPLNYLL